MAKTLDEATRDGEFDPSVSSISCGNCGAVFQHVDEAAEDRFDRAATYADLEEHEARCSRKRRYRSDANAVGYAD